MSLAQNLRDFELEKHFSRWEFAASHHFTASDAESMGIDELLALGTEDDRARFAKLHLGYVPTWGTDELRETIASTYDQARARDVLTFAGAGEALFWAMQLFLEPGAHAIATAPNYQSIESIPRALGVDLTGMPLWSSEGGETRWTFDLDLFESLLRPRTALVSVNFPNNPTGFVPDQETWAQLVELCDTRGILLVSDEVHRGIELDPSRTLPQAADLSERALSIGVLSKAYGLPGLRVGWVTCRDPEILGRLERAKHYTSICNAGPSEFLATLALRQRADILSRNRAVVAGNLPAVRELFERHADTFRFEPPGGGCVAYPRYLGDDGVESFCRRAVEEHGVLMLPASIYRSDLLEVPSDHFRIGLGRRDVPACLERLNEHLAAR